MSEFRGIVRVAGKDLKGELPLPRALDSIKGIGFNISDSIANVASARLNVQKNEKIGNLNDQQLKQLEEVILHPEKHGIPVWQLNRQRDPSSSESHHLVMSDLDFQKKQDIELMKNMRSYRGVRHMYGLPVRGQRTRTMGRRGMTLGVIRKKEMPGKVGETKGREEKK
ncbi:30S ribosomal protein S13 [archaeon]|nr:30S ribosomal protein S13 [archaeon]